MARHLAGAVTPLLIRATLFLATFFLASCTKSEEVRKPSAPAEQPAGKGVSTGVSTAEKTPAAAVPAKQETTPAKKETPTTGAPAPAVPPLKPDTASQPAAGAAAEKAVPDDPKALEIIDKYLAAIGGKETLALIKDRSIYFTNKKFQPTGTTESKMARFMKGSYQVREQWDFPGFGITEGQESLNIVQVYDGKQGWVKMMGYVSPLDGKTLTMFVWDKYIDDFFLHWKQDGFHAKYRGEKKIDDVATQCIEMETRGSNNKQYYYFRNDDSLLYKKEWRAEDPNGGVNKKELIYSQYQKIRLADQPERTTLVAINEKVFTDGELDLERDYTEIKVNSGLGDELFARPEGQDFEEFQKEKTAKDKAEKAADKDKPKEKEKPGAHPKTHPTTQPAAKEAPKEPVADPKEPEKSPK